MLLLARSNFYCFAYCMIFIPNISHTLILPDEINNTAHVFQYYNFASIFHDDSSRFT